MMSADDLMEIKVDEPDKPVLPVGVGRCYPSGSAGVPGRFEPERPKRFRQ